MEDGKDVEHRKIAVNFSLEIETKENPCFSVAFKIRVMVESSVYLILLM